MVRRRLILALGAALGVALMWTGAPDVSAQNSGQTALTFDSGVVPIGPNQILRVTVTNVGTRNARARTGFMDYTDDSCAPGVTCYQVSGAGADLLRTIPAGGALSLITEIGMPAVRFRLRITGTNPQVRISGQIVDATTGVIQDYYAHSNWATFPSS